MKYRVIPALILVPGDCPQSEAWGRAGVMQLAACVAGDEFGGRIYLDENRADGFAEVPPGHDLPGSVDDPRIQWPEGKTLA